MAKISIAKRRLESPEFDSPTSAEIRARLNLAQEDLECLSFPGELPESRAALETGQNADGCSTGIPIEDDRRSAIRNIIAGTGKDSRLVFNLHPYNADMKMLAPKDLSNILALSTGTVYRLAKNGSLRSYRTGRRLRFNFDDVMDFLAPRIS